MTEASATARTWRALGTFTIHGPPVGYYAEGARPNHRRRTEYVTWKKRVQVCALAAGFRIPLEATREHPLRVHVVPYFRNGVHCDPGNVQKGVCDALFYKPKGMPGPKGGDKYTGGSFPPPLYDADEPRTEVIVEGVADGAIVPGKRCSACHPGPLNEGVHCELGAGHLGRHRVKPADLAFEWK